MHACKMHCTCQVGGAPVKIFWIGPIPWEADLYLLLSYKWWLNVGTTKGLTTLGTSTIHHNGTAKDCIKQITVQVIIIAHLQVEHTINERLQLASYVISMYNIFQTHLWKVQLDVGFHHRMNRFYEDWLSPVPAQALPASHWGLPLHISTVSVKSNRPGSQTLQLCSLYMGCTGLQHCQCRFHCSL